MTLPKKAEKGYLEVTDRPGGFVIVGHQEHLGDLAPLLSQNGVVCRLEGDSAEGGALVFDASADRAKVAQILEEYKTAKGS
jgi:hypothetical protein